MKIVVCSDNHGESDYLHKIIEDNNDATLFIHCGDSEMFEYELSPFITVKGNNDYYINEDSKTIDYKGFKAYVMHGHKNYLSKEVLVSIARNKNVNFVLFGHIHRPFYYNEGNIHVICPGSLAYPRSSEGITYAVIDFNSIDDVKVKFISL